MRADRAVLAREVMLDSVRMFTSADPDRRSPLAAGRCNRVSTGNPELSGVFVAVLQDPQEAGPQRFCPAELLEDAETGDCLWMVLSLVIEELLRGRCGERQSVVPDLHG
jgi:hypothetical protein